MVPTYWKPAHVFKIVTYGNGDVRCVGKCWGQGGDRCRWMLYAEIATRLEIVSTLDKLAKTHPSDVIEQDLRGLARLFLCDWHLVQEEDTAKLWKGVINSAVENVHVANAAGASATALVGRFMQEVELIDSGQDSQPPSDRRNDSLPDVLRRHLRSYRLNKRSLESARKALEERNCEISTLQEKQAKYENDLKEEREYQRKLEKTLGDMQKQQITLAAAHRAERLGLRANLEEATKTMQHLRASLSAQQAEHQQATHVINTNDRHTKAFEKGKVDVRDRLKTLSWVRELYTDGTRNDV